MAAVCTMHLAISGGMYAFDDIVNPCSLGIPPESLCPYLRQSMRFGLICVVKLRRCLIRSGAACPVRLPPVHQLAAVLPIPSATLHDRDVAQRSNCR